MKLKVCGLKDRENILQVLECKPDFIGFIFYQKSPRYIGALDVEFVRGISSVKKVGVFVNETEINILDHVSRYGLDLVQLHGDEGPAFCAAINKFVPVIKAFQIDDGFDFSKVIPFENTCQYFLFDSKSEQYGGSGKKFNHEKLKEYRSAKPFFVSGGIDLGDIVSILHGTSPLLPLAAVDVNSRFEISPGIKSIDKLRKINLSDKQHEARG